MAQIIGCEGGFYELDLQSGLEGLIAGNGEGAGYCGLSYFKSTGMLWDETIDSTTLTPTQGREAGEARHLTTRVTENCARNAVSYRYAFLRGLVGRNRTLEL